MIQEELMQKIHEHNMTINLSSHIWHYPSDGDKIIEWLDYSNNSLAQAITKLFLESLDIAEISKIIHNVCRGEHWACDSWGEQELAEAVVDQITKRWL